MKTILRRALKVFLTALVIFIVGLSILFLVVSAPPRPIQESNTLNDVTALNPISASMVHRPHSKEEIAGLIRNNAGPISIGGARHSMGGQIGNEGTVHLDMREFDKVVQFSESEKEITIQSGITWRKVQEFIDPYFLSVSIMQTYSNFTVGGSLSVNVHGRYIGQGPIIHSVKSMKVILADGNLVECSPQQNADIFYGVIGGYGGLGVIAEVTLQLTTNIKVERQSEVMPVEAYSDYFTKYVDNDTTLVFHNADIYPNDYKRVRSVSYVQTEKPLTIDDRLVPLNKNYRMERFAMWMVSEMYGGKWMRQKIADPIFYSRDKVVWRNYEASYDAMELEPTSRENYTYVLQEYFVPVTQFDSFVPVMTEILQRYNVNVINISIRHARKDKGSLLAWAEAEVFCFVLYYKQGTKSADKNEVGNWTRELIDAAIDHEGSYYLPYQLHATEEQFKKAYGNASKFFSLKAKLDPTNKFRNMLWDKYYKP
jgi:FAD/FMN-containing dehydrogenase